MLSGMHSVGLLGCLCSWINDPCGALPAPNILWFDDCPVPSWDLRTVLHLTGNTCHGTVLTHSSCKAEVQMWSFCRYHSLLQPPFYTVQVSTENCAVTAALGSWNIHRSALWEPALVPRLGSQGTQWHWRYFSLRQCPACHLTLSDWGFKHLNCMSKLQAENPALFWRDPVSASPNPTGTWPFWSGFMESAAEI